MPYICWYEKWNPTLMVPRIETECFKDWSSSCAMQMEPTRLDGRCRASSKSIFERMLQWGGGRAGGLSWMQWLEKCCLDSASGESQGFKLPSFVQLGDKEESCTSRYFRTLHNVEIFNKDPATVGTQLLLLGSSCICSIPWHLPHFNNFQPLNLCLNEH